VVFDKYLLRGAKKNKHFSLPSLMEKIGEVDYKIVLLEGL